MKYWNKKTPTGTSYDCFYTTVMAKTDKITLRIACFDKAKLLELPKTFSEIPIVLPNQQIGSFQAVLTATEPIKIKQKRGYVGTFTITSECMENTQYNGVFGINQYAIEKDTYKPELKPDTVYSVFDRKDFVSYLNKAIGEEFYIDLVDIGKLSFVCKSFEYVPLEPGFNPNLSTIRIGEKDCIKRAFQPKGYPFELAHSEFRRDEAFWESVEFLGKGVERER